MHVMMKIVRLNFGFFWVFSSVFYHFLISFLDFYFSHQKPTAAREKLLMSATFFNYIKISFFIAEKSDESKATYPHPPTIISFIVLFFSFSFVCFVVLSHYPEEFITIFFFLSLLSLQDNARAMWGWGRVAMAKAAVAARKKKAQHDAKNNNNEFPCTSRGMKEKNWMRMERFRVSYGWWWWCWERDGKLGAFVVRDTWPHLVITFFNLKFFFQIWKSLNQPRPRVKNARRTLKTPKIPPWSIPWPTFFFSHFFLHPSLFLSFSTHSTRNFLLSLDFIFSFWFLISRQLTSLSFPLLIIPYFIIIIKTAPRQQTNTHTHTMRVRAKEKERQEREEGKLKE
jgi:hypothetical protein